jgi:uracil-DNA glycosylase
MSDAIAKLQRDILQDYASSVELPAKARYFGGARLRPVVPLDTATAGYFILGAYPSAQFETVGAENDVPVGDNLGPFEPQRYFDGRRVRTQASADELEAYYLAPLGISRSQCWITDIVKVFLFKEGHREKYARLGVTAPARYERERFEELASRSLPWIERELELACPRLVITLGSEIAGILRDVASPTRRNALLGSGITPVRFGGREFPTVHLAHPGIVMRKGDGTKNPWPRLHEQEHIPALKASLASL